MSQFFYYFLAIWGRLLHMLLNTLVPPDTQIRQQTAQAQPWANHVEPTGFTNDCYQKVVMSVLQVKVVSDTSWTLWSCCWCRHKIIRFSHSCSELLQDVWCGGEGGEGGGGNSEHGGEEGREGMGGGGRPWAGVKESGEMKIPKYLPLSICLPNWPQHGLGM